MISINCSVCIIKGVADFEYSFNFLPLGHLAVSAAKLLSANLALQELNILCLSLSDYLTGIYHRPFTKDSPGRNFSRSFLAAARNPGDMRDSDICCPLEALNQRAYDKRGTNPGVSDSDPERDPRLYGNNNNVGGFRCLIYWMH